MSWILIAITSYFINAGVYVADKFILSKKMHSSIVYAFWVGIWSIFNLAILVFDPWLPNWQELSLDILAGILFLVTLIFWYKALHQSEATRVVPLVGAMVPIFSLVLSFIFLNQSLGEKELLAFVILIVGGTLISVKQTKIYSLPALSKRLRSKFGEVFGLVHARYRSTRRLIFNSLSSAILFASYYTLMKYIYTQQPFVGAFVWSRIGSFIGVLLILFVPEWRAKIKDSQKEKTEVKNFSFFISVRLLAALAFIMLNWAISLGSVAIINALQGVQYLFLILIVLFLSKRFPRVMKEELGRGVMLQKISGIILVSIGLYMLIK